MNLHLGVRHWDHVVPLALGDVPEPAGLELRLTRLDSTPNLWTAPEYDGGETSLSSYVRARAAGDERIVALPIFVMRGFRQRCIIVARDSPAETAADLKGARIGLTGWPDSGNTWTRAILGEAGVGVDDAEWQVGPLTAAHPVVDRIGGVRVGANVTHTRDGATLEGLLRAGDLDAVMTPFMPSGFYAEGSPLRTLYRDCRSAERDYFARNGFIPGMHVLAVRTEVLAQRPDLAQQLVDLFEQAKRVSFSRRNKLMDVAPWHNEEVAVTTQVFGEDWLPYGVSPDRPMVDAFQAALVSQRLLDVPVPHQQLFPHAVDPSPTSVGPVSQEATV